MEGTMQQWLARPEHAQGDKLCNESFAQQAVAAVACLHDHGLSHHDVHAGNWLYRQRGACPDWFLGDFELLDKTSPAAIVEDWRDLGTPLYMMERGLGAETSGDRRSFGLGGELVDSRDPARFAREWLRTRQDG